MYRVGFAKFSTAYFDGAMHTLRRSIGRLQYHGLDEKVPQITLDGGCPLFLSAQGDLVLPSYITAPTLSRPRCDWRSARASWPKS